MGIGDSASSSTRRRRMNRPRSSSRCSRASSAARWRRSPRSSARTSASSGLRSKSRRTDFATASRSATSSISRSRPSSPSAWRRESPSGSWACSTPSAPNSPSPRRSARRSTPSGSSTRGRRACRRPSSPGPPEAMIEAAHARPAGAARLMPTLAAVRARLGLIVLLFALAAAAWWFTVDRMRGMDDGPGTDLGTLGWFVGVWVVMMAAMMFPSVSPTVALYSRMTRSREPLAPLVFTSGYLLTWTAAGVLAFGLSDLGGSLLGDELAWDRAGRWLAGGVLVVAALYELTPLKDVCLGKCRSPLGFLIGSWRGGLSGALQMGTKAGAWCVGCCWADGRALRARRDEHRLDGVRGGSDRGREDTPLGPCGDVWNGGAPAPARGVARGGA